MAKSKKPSKIKRGIVSVPTKPLGASGLEVEEGQIVNNDTQSEMIGVDGLKRIRAMQYDDEVAWTSYWIYNYLMQGASYTISPAGENATDKSAADFVQDIIDDMSQSWMDFMGLVGTEVRDGFSLFEMIFKQRLGINLEDIEESSKFNDGKWGLKKLAFRGQMTIKEGAWIGLETGDWIAVKQVLPDGSEKVIDRKYLINFTTFGDDSNPEGISLLRGMHRSSRDRRKLENTENIGHSRNTKGTLNIKVPPEILRKNAKPDEKAMYSQVKKIAKNYHVDEHGTFISPMMYDKDGNSLYEVEAMNGGTGGMDIDVPIKRKMQSSAMTMFTDWLLLGHSSGGNRSLSGDRYDLMLKVINTLLQRIADTLNKVLVPKLLLINNIPVNVGLPEFTFASLEKADVEKVAKVMKDLTMAGMDFSDEETEDWMRSEIGAPERPEDSARRDAEEKEEEPKKKKDEEVKTEEA